MSISQSITSWHKGVRLLVGDLIAREAAGTLAEGSVEKAGSMISEGVPLRAWAVAKRKRFGLNSARLSVHLSSTL